MDYQDSFMLKSLLVNKQIQTWLSKAGSAAASQREAMLENLLLNNMDFTIGFS